MTTYNFQFPKIGTLKLLSVWIKGKNNKGTRYLMENINTGEISLLWFEPFDLFSKGGYKVETSEEITTANYKKRNHIKIGSYNYYLSNLSYTDFEIDINIWLNDNSYFPETLNSFSHVPMNEINYKPVIITR